MGLNLKKLIKKEKWANSDLLEKSEKFIERFREVLSDPLNLLIERIPSAGYITKDGYIILHNGNLVPISGKYSYYGKFSDLLILNRGVHEPLEEYCFQELLKKLKKENEEPKMLELGAYWSHYSMWMLSSIPKAICTLVEPNKHNINVGKNNFRINNFKGEFINKFVSKAEFTVDKWLENNTTKLSLLHCDIQGYEYEMIENSKNSLESNAIDYIMISTHSEDIHNNIIDYMKKFKYRLEVSSDFNYHTTSNDGFLLFSSEDAPKIFVNFHPMGRLEILKSSPSLLLSYLNKTIN